MFLKLVVGHIVSFQYARCIIVLLLHDGQQNVFGVGGPLTEERRKDLAKRSKTVAEEAKVGIRNIRRNANDDAKKLKDEGVSEDEVKLVTEKIQELTAMPR